VADRRISGKSEVHASEDAVVDVESVGSSFVLGRGVGEKGIEGSGLISCAAALQARVVRRSGTIHRNLMTNRWFNIFISSQGTG
jgi:hypothetical protein